MKILFSLLVAFIIISCSNNKKEKEAPVVVPEEKPVVVIDTTLVTDSSWGPIKKTTDFVALQAAYGTTNVKDERICGAECVDSVDVTLIYPETDKEIIVFWKDSLYHKTIGSVENRSAKSPYHTALGVKSGSTMTELLKINGKKINFGGFGWDYGGGVMSYNKGSMENTKIHFILDIDEGGSDKLQGEKDLNTDMPEVKKDMDKIHVWTISLSFYEY